MAYTDLTTTFTYNRRCIATEFDALAVNQKLAYDVVSVANPRFSVYHSATQTPGTKVSFDTEDFDVGNYYDPSTARFTPPQGQYHLTAGLVLDSSGIADNTLVLFEIRQSGSVIRQFTSNTGVATKDFAIQLSAIVNNGGSSYYEVHISSGSSLVKAGISNCWFQGRRVYR